ncbi:hypothetical protein NOVOSPHI9U_50437 [Novosphingobium sp. 9U]|nr:hypothetical protein NOVOSPHI9U_50437 [Novosphingobium sp. 9U]
MIARLWNEVKATSGRMPLSLSSAPAARASASPFSVRSTSHQPVKRFSRFHWLWPWRTRIRRGKGAGSLAVALLCEDPLRLVAQALAFRGRVGKSGRVVFGGARGRTRCIRVERTGLRLAAVQVLAQLGGEALLARLRVLSLGHACRHAVSLRKLQAALDIPDARDDRARLPGGPHSWPAGCTLL